MDPWDGPSAGNTASASAAAAAADGPARMEDSTPRWSAVAATAAVPVDAAAGSDAGTARSPLTPETFFVVEESIRALWESLSPARGLGASGKVTPAAFLRLMWQLDTLASGETAAAPAPAAAAATTTTDDDDDDDTAAAAKPLLAQGTLLSWKRFLSAATATCREGDLTSSISREAFDAFFWEFAENARPPADCQTLFHRWAVEVALRRHRHEEVDILLDQLQPPTAQGIPQGWNMNTAVQRILRVDNVTASASGSRETTLMVIEHLLKQHGQAPWAWWDQVRPMLSLLVPALIPGGDTAQRRQGLAAFPSVAHALREVSALLPPRRPEGGGAQTVESSMRRSASASSASSRVSSSASRPFSRGGIEGVSSDTQHLLHMLGLSRSAGAAGQDGVRARSQHQWPLSSVGDRGEGAVEGEPEPEQGRGRGRRAGDQVGMAAPAMQPQRPAVEDTRQGRRRDYYASRAGGPRCVFNRPMHVTRRQATKSSLLAQIHHANSRAPQTRPGAFLVRPATFDGHHAGRMNGAEIVAAGHTAPGAGGGVSRTKSGPVGRRRRRRTKKKRCKSGKRKGPQHRSQRPTTAPSGTRRPATAGGAAGAGAATAAAEPSAGSTTLMNVKSLATRRWPTYTDDPVARLQSGMRAVSAAPAGSGRSIGRQPKWTKSQHNLSSRVRGSAAVPSSREAAKGALRGASARANKLATRMRNRTNGSGVRVGDPQVPLIPLDARRLRGRNERPPSRAQREAAQREAAVAQREAVVALEGGPSAQACDGPAVTVAVPRVKVDIARSVATATVTLGMPPSRAGTPDGGVSDAVEMRTKPKPVPIGALAENVIPIVYAQNVIKSGFLANQPVLSVGAHKLSPRRSAKFRERLVEHYGGADPYLPDSPRPPGSNVKPKRPAKPRPVVGPATGPASPPVQTPSLVLLAVGTTEEEKVN